MSTLDRSALRTTETVLAILVLLVVMVITVDGPFQVPSWPTLGGVPVNPVLIFPGLLGVVALLGAVADGLRIRSLVVSVLGFVTLFLATVSLHALYANTAGGVFWGGFITLAVGVLLALVILAWRAVREATRRDVRAIFTQ